jgi:hypothetical protein
MSHYLQWLHHNEKRIFFWCNHTIKHRILDGFLGLLTHIGGAVFTIICTLSIALFATDVWGRLGWQSFAALSGSHIIAVIVALSNFYLGLHYPSDCLAGCLIGTISALMMVVLI